MEGCRRHLLKVVSANEEDANNEEAALFVYEFPRDDDNINRKSVSSSRM